MNFLMTLPSSSILDAAETSRNKGQHRIDVYENPKRTAHLNFCCVPVSCKSIALRSCLWNVVHRVRADKRIKSLQYAHHAACSSHYRFRIVTNMAKAFDHSPPDPISKGPTSTGACSRVEPDGEIGTLTETVANIGGSCGSRDDLKQDISNNGYSCTGTKV